MKLAKRIIAVVGAPALLAGFMLAGSAGAAPATKKPTTNLPYSVAFTANVIVGTDSYTLNSTACTLTGGGGLKHPCFLGGSGYIGLEEDATGNFALQGAPAGPVSFSVVEESGNCGDGSAVVIQPSGPVPSNVKMTITKVTETSSNMFTVKGTVKIGPSVTPCSLDL